MNACDSQQPTANSKQPLHYMRCAILAANPTGIDGWDIETLRGVYHLTPRPEVAFAEWRRRMNGGSGPAARASF